MTTDDIKEGVQLICEASKKIQSCYENKQVLVNEINNAE